MSILDKTNPKQQQIDTLTAEAGIILNKIADYPNAYDFSGINGFNEFRDKVGTPISAGDWVVFDMSYNESFLARIVDFKRYKSDGEKGLKFFMAVVVFTRKHYNFYDGTYTVNIDTADVLPNHLVKYDINQLTQHIEQMKPFKRLEYLKNQNPANFI